MKIGLFYFYTWLSFGNIFVLLQYKYYFMSNEILNPTKVDCWQTGKALAIKYFIEDLGDESHVFVQGELTNGHYEGKIFRAYTELNPDNHFYFTTNE